MTGAWRMLVVTGPLAMASACGGGGSGSSSVGGEGSIGAPEGVCDAPIYREIVGTYRGRVTYDRVLEDGSLEPRCVWDLVARVIVDSDVIGCELDLVTESSVEQPIVPASSERNLFQCIEEEGLRSLRDPNGIVEPDELDLVSFPLDFGYALGQAPATGPYFGDPNVTTFYTRLFDSSSALVDAIRFDGSGLMSLQAVGLSENARFSGDLLKEAGQ